MKRVIFGFLALTLVIGWPSSGRAAGLTLTIRNGRVSLDAEDVTIRQILTEWVRVGKTQIVNLERVNTATVTLKFDGLTEDEALDIILRTLPGYMAAPRATAMADASMYDRILIMPTTTAVAATAAPRAQFPLQDPGANVTQLRPASPPLSPGILPDLPEDPRSSIDPALAAAAAAAGLITVPAPQPAGLAPRNPGISLYPTQTQGPASTVGSAANPWNAPVGTSQPGLAPPPPPPSTTIPPPNRTGNGARPQQADQ